MFKKIISIIIASLFLFSNISYALSPELASRVPATRTAMDAQGEARFIDKHGPCPVNFSTETNPVEDVCITIPQLKKAYTAFTENRINRKSYDLFAPKAPHEGGYIVASGLEVALADIRERKFNNRYIERLRQLNIFSEEFLSYLSNFVFEGDIDAVPEGTVVSAGIPIMRIRE